MKTSLNKINGQYLGQSKLYENDGLLTVNKHYNEYIGGSWIRPEEWLQMPSLEGITQAIVGLLAVIPGFDSGHTGITSNSNFMSVRASGAYNVDWGDGTTSAHATNTTASKQYNYYSLPNVNFTKEGYKQIFITITPQSGNNLTFFGLGNKPVLSGITIGINSANILHWLVKTPFLTTTTSVDVNNIRFPLCKIIEFIGPTQVATNTNITQNMSNMEVVSGEQWTTDTTTGFNNLFTNCDSLSFISMLDTRKATTMVSTFSNCFRIKLIPPLHTSTVTNFTNTFSANESLEILPYLDTSGGQTWTSTFQSCRSLMRIPNLNFSNAINTNSTFAQCRSLEYVPSEMILSNSTNTASMFFECSSLRRVPDVLDVSKSTSANRMFGSCIILEKVPDLNLISGVGNAIGELVNGNVNMWKTGLITLGTGATGPHTNAFSLSRVVISGISWAGGTLQGISFANISTTVGFFPQSLRVAPAYNVGSSISYRDTQLSPTAINEVFTSLALLPSGATATINITNVWGSSGCDRTIATSKNWTVIG